MLRSLLDGVVPRPDLDRIAEAWLRDGPPADAGQRVRAVLDNPREWQSRITPAVDSRADRGPDRPPPPSRGE